MLVPTVLNLRQNQKKKKREPKKFSNDLLLRKILSYRSAPDHSYPSLTSFPTVQALQYTIPDSHVPSSHSLRIQTQNIDDINRSFVNILVEFYVSGRVPCRTL